jgi:putative FmdB family regulatory protein
MPTYHYICEKCDHEFEIFQSMTEPALKACPKDKCGEKKWGRGKVRRVLSGGAGIIFKGSGFYSTDYRSEGYKQAAKKDAESAAPKAASDAAKTGSAKSDTSAGSGKKDSKTSASKE